MKLTGCSDSHFIWSVQDGEVKKVYNTDSHGRPNLMFKNLQDIYQHTNLDSTPLPFAQRYTITTNDYAVSVGEEELTLSQLKKTCKPKRKKSLLLEDDDSDLSEPLFKFRVKLSKRLQTNKKPVNPSLPTSQLTKHLAETRFLLINSVPECTESGSEVSLDSLENMEVDNIPFSVSQVEIDECVNQSSSCLSSMLEDWTATTSDCSQSQQTPEEVNYISSGQDSDPIVDQGSLRNQKYCSPSIVPDHVDDVVPTEAKSPESEGKEHLTSDNTVSDLTSTNSDNIVFVPAKTDSGMKLDDHNYQTDIKSDKTSEIKNSCCTETRQPERLPLTRKVICPNSQKKLCQAMESAELLDDMDNYKCKEKLYFGEQAENKFSSTKLNVEDNELNVDSRQGPQFIQNKVGFSSKNVLRRAKNCKKGSPLKKGCVDGPRLCRSLPRLSTGCTSIQGCSENAIAFSQRQMHDIETLASKLMSELDSMKALVEEKLLYEAYRSPTLKNDADEVKSAIKNATKTEEAAKRWLCMMTRDCNRFCKIMKLNEDDDAPASADPVLGNTIHEKPLQRERKKISFADEAGGTLCDIKVFQIDGDSLELQ